MTTLIISPDITWTSRAQQAFIVQGLPCDVAYNGKDAQLMSYHKKYSYFVLDIETQNHPAIDVCKYLRKTCPLGKLLVTISSNKKLEEMLLDEKKLLKMGVNKVLFQPEPETIVSAIQDIGQIRKWKNVQETGKPQELDKDEEIIDAEFSRIKITELFGDSLAVFDYYIRLSSNRFVKIIHKGEKASQEQLSKYESSGTHFLFFLKKDRSTFISYQNDLARELIKTSGQNDGAKVIQAMKSTTDKYFEEIFTMGIQPNLIEEGKSICQNMFDVAKKDQGLSKFINDLEQFNPAALSHAFLVSFFSMLICKDLDWVGKKSVETLALGALFHDIGILQLPPEIREMDPSLMTPDQLTLYKTHPSLGAEALRNIPGLNVGVIQIVLQHHEKINGNGYPEGISGHKIYPLAKVVSLADGFSYFLKEKGLSPIEGLKVFLRYQDNLVAYDPMLMKNLINALK